MLERALKSACQEKIQQSPPKVTPQPTIQPPLTSPVAPARRASCDTKRDHKLVNDENQRPASHPSPALNTPKKTTQPAVQTSPESSEESSSTESLKNRTNHLTSESPQRNYSVTTGQIHSSVPFSPKTPSDSQRSRTLPTPHTDSKNPIQQRQQIRMSPLLTTQLKPPDSYPNKKSHSDSNISKVSSFVSKKNAKNLDVVHHGKKAYAQHFNPGSRSPDRTSPTANHKVRPKGWFLTWWKNPT